MGSSESIPLRYLSDDTASAVDDINMYINVIQTGNISKGMVILQELYTKYKDHPEIRKTIATLKKRPFAVSHLPAWDPFHEFDIDKVLAQYA